jgi:hypothetical protein
LHSLQGLQSGELALKRVAAHINTDAQKVAGEYLSFYGGYF